MFPLRPLWGCSGVADASNRSSSCRMVHKTLTPFQASVFLVLGALCIGLPLHFLLSSPCPPPPPPPPIRALHEVAGLTSPFAG